MTIYDGMSLKIDQVLIVPNKEMKIQNNSKNKQKKVVPPWHLNLGWATRNF